MGYVKITEQPSLYNDLEKMSPLEILTCINREDHKVADAVQEVIPAIERLVEGATERMKRGGRLFYIGSGTSGRVGVVDASEIPPTFGMPSSLVVGIIAGGDRAIRCAVEGAEDNAEQGWKELEAHNVSERDTLVGIAASGTTPYVIGALKEARKRGLLTACITSNPDSPITEVAEIAITPVVGPEFVTGSSRMKSGTAQKLICNMITTSIMIGLGRVRGNKMVNMQLSNRKLVDRGTRMLVEELGLSYDEAKQLLLVHGEVQRALEAYRGADGD
ncbi:MAG: N-acetylmuramic acid 6-phosphate etherase [Alistipes sp.]|nr:N-acetylmuramic acid 6-phosphate etherase [Alistipes sp.]